MPFDALTMAAVTDELNSTVAGGQLQRIIQPSLHAVGVSIYAGGHQHWLVASADARFARVHLTGGKLAKAFPTPSSFVMLLRKYLEGGRLRAVEQIPHERIIRLQCGARDSEVVLVVEVMGKHSNVILLDPDRKILGAIKIVPPRQSRVRPIIVGRRYELPPAHARNEELFGVGERVDPVRDRDDFVRLLSIAPSQVPVRTALLGLLPGAGPFLCDQIALRAGVDGSQPVSEVEIDRLADAARYLFSLPTTGEWHPSAFSGERGRMDFAPFEPLDVRALQRTKTISEAIELATGAEETRDVLSTTRKGVLDDIERARRAVHGRLHSLQRGLESANDADTVMERGQLILAYGYGISEGATEIEIPDLDVRIPLDPLLTPSENAERLFRRYRKLKDAQHRIPPMIDAAQHELERLDELATFAQLVTSEADLQLLGQELRPVTGGDAKRPKIPKRRGPPRFRMDNWTAIVGRTARENDEVSFKLAGRDDLWLHASGRTGAHVIVQGGTRDLPDGVLSAAASLAAYFSSGRNDTAVDVDAAAVRDVRKIPGGAPGKVTYRNSRTVRVSPDLTGWTRIGS